MGDLPKKKEKTTEGQDDLSVVQSDPPNNQENNHSESMEDPLIPQVGRDLSINLLLYYLSRFYYGVMASLNKGFQYIIRSGEIYRLRRKFGITEPWIYLSCELTKWFIFDPINLKWMRLPNMSASECFTCADKESLAVGTELLVFGKDINDPLIYRYSLPTNTWSTGMKLNDARFLFASASLGEMAIAAGGCASDGALRNSAECYVTNRGTWERIPSMNIARKMCAGVFMDGKFYVLGGLAEKSEVLESGEVYDSITRTWTVIEEMFPVFNKELILKSSPPLVAVVNNELYAIDRDLHVLMRYEKMHNIWITLGALPEGVVSMNGWGIAFKACGNKLILIGAPKGGGIEVMLNIYAWTPNEIGPPVWEVMATRRSPGFVYNCAVMGC